MMVVFLPGHITLVAEMWSSHCSVASGKVMGLSPVHVIIFVIALKTTFTIYNVQIFHPGDWRTKNAFIFSVLFSVSTAKASEVYSKCKI